MSRPTSECFCRNDGGLNGNTTTYCNGDVVCDYCQGIIIAKPTECPCCGCSNKKCLPCVYMDAKKCSDCEKNCESIIYETVGA